MPAADHPVPRHPGRILLEDYLIPMRLSQYDAAKRLYAPESTVNGVVAGTEKLTWSLAKRMSAVFGKTPKFWMESQRAWDKWRLEQSGVVKRSMTRSVREVITRFTVVTPPDMFC